MIRYGHTAPVWRRHRPDAPGRTVLRFSWHRPIARPGGAVTGPVTRAGPAKHCDHGSNSARRTRRPADPMP
eukprot:441905-Hanusia_phi.AAC.1